MKKIFSFILAVAVVFSSLTLFMPAPKVAAATTYTLGGAGSSDPLKIIVNADGSQGLYFYQSSGYVQQYFAGQAWGTNLYLTKTEGSMVTPLHYLSPYYNVSGTQLGSGTLTQSGDTVTCSWLLDGGNIRFDQIIQYTSGSYSYNKTFRITNLSAAISYSNAKLFHGGDTYFGGADAATSYWNPDLKMVYVRNADMTTYGLMGFAGYSATPSNAYFGGYYYDGFTLASTTGQLNNTVTGTSTDAGYQLQWNRDGITPGQTWEIQSYEMITSPGAIQVISPSQQSAVQGSSITYTFYVQNFSTSSQTINLSAASSNGWSTSIGSSQITLAPNGGSSPVNVTVQIPANAGGVRTDTVTLTASAAQTKTGAVTTNVMYSPSLTLNPVSSPTGIGSQLTLTAVLSNGASPTGTVTFKNGSTVLGTAAVSGGAATLNYTPTSTGDLSITAVYSGDTNNASAQTASAAAVTIQPRQTILTLSASPESPAEFPENATYTVNLSNFYGTISGQQVTITVDGTPHTVTADAGGNASFTLTPTSAKSYTVTADYAGNANNLSSSATSLSYSYDKGTQTAPVIVLENGTAAITYGDNLPNYKVAASGGESTGAYQYSSSNPAALGVDSATGAITVNGAGNARITVIRLGDDNYNVSSESGINISVAPKVLTITNVSVRNKIYDGTVSASFSGTTALSGIINGDDVTLINGTPTFADKNYSSSPITVNFSSFSISGPDKDNYSLTQPASVSASIDKKTIAVSVEPVIINCGQAIPALSVTVNAADFIGGETQAGLAASGFVKPTASQSYGSTITPVSDKDFTVTYNGGTATNNYTFGYVTTAKITINPVYVTASDYQVVGNYSVSTNPTSWNKSDLTVTPLNGYDLISTDGNSWSSTISVTGEALNGSVSFKLKKSTDGTQTEMTAIYYNLDKTAPTGTIDIKENKFTSFLNTITFGIFFKETLAVTIGGEDIAGASGNSGISTIEYQKVASQAEYDVNATWTTGSTLNVTPDEQFIVFAKITDNAGNVVLINSNGVVTDDTAPVITAVYGNDNIWTAETDGKIAVTVTDNLAGVDDVTYTINGGTPVVASPDFEITSLAEGNYTVSITATDYSGNSSTTDITVKKDTSAPVIDITYIHDNIWTTDPDAELAVAVTDSVSGTTDVTCSMNGMTFHPGDDFQFTTLADGSYTVTVTAADRAGNTASESVTVKKDTAAPTITADGDTDSYRQSDIVSVETTAGASGISKVEVQKDGGSFADITAVYTSGYEVTENGIYTFRVINGAGISETTSIEYDKIDRVQPTVSISSNGYTENSWTNAAVTLNITNAAANMGLTMYEVSTDGVSFAPFNGEYVVSDDSSELYSFRATSASGVVSDIVTFEVQVDKTLPTGKISIAANDFMTFLNTITFNLFFKDTTSVTIEGFDTDNPTVNSGVAKVEYQKTADAADFDVNGTWTEGDAFSVTPDEKFIVYARITDLAGNVVLINSNGAVTDDTAPVITAVYGKDNIWTAETDGKIAVTVTDNLAGVDDVTYTINGGTPVVASPDFEITGLADGSYTVTVTATDRAGNTASESVTVKKDTAAPTITADGDTDSYRQSDIVSVETTAGVSGISKVEVQKDDGSFTDITAVYTSGYEVTENGIYTFRVINGAGISEITSIEYDKIDRVQPTVSINSNGYTESSWTNAAVTLDITNAAANMGLTMYEVSTDGVSFTPFNGEYVVSDDSSELYSFRATSASGVVSDIVTFEVQVDKTLPTGKISIAANDFMTFLNTITFNLFFKDTTSVTIEGFDTDNPTVNSGVAKVEYQKTADAADFDVNGTWTEGDAFSVTPDEKFIVYARITDLAGNVFIINSQGTVVYTDSLLSLADALFDPDTTKPEYKDIQVSVMPAGNTVNQIEFAGKKLSKDVDYTSDGNIITIRKEYLKDVVSGTISLTFTFNPLGEEYVQGDVPETAHLSITQIIHAQAPAFTQNLSAGATCPKNDPAPALSVETEVINGGTVTYQWYISSTPQSDGEAISGATKAGYTPETSVTGVFYYYVVATNTDNSVNGEKTTTSKSDTFRLVVNNSELLPPVISVDSPKISLPGDIQTIINSVLSASDDKKLEEGSDISIYLKIARAIGSQEDKDTASGTAGGNTIFEFYDISLIKKIDGIETKVTKTDSPIRITLEIPEDMRNTDRVWSIIRVHNGVAVTLADLDSDPNTFTFESDCFSTYALAYLDKVTLTVKTGEDASGMQLYIIGAAMMISALYIVLSRRSRTLQMTDKSAAQNDKSL